MKAPDRQYLFGPFRLHPVDGLFRGNEPIPLRPKPLLLLVHLVRHPGRVLSTSMILSDLWTDTTVDARGLKVYVSQLRKALGDGHASPTYIETLPKRGYRFKSPVTVIDGPPADFPHPRGADHAAATASAPPAHMADAEPFVDREIELGRLDDLLRHVIGGSGRLVFVTGEAGIGKTTLANEFLRRTAGGQTHVLIARGRAVEQYGPGEAYLPFLDALGTLLASPDGGQVAAVLRTQAPTWCLQLPAAFASMATLAQLLRETIGATKERMLRELGDALAVLTAEVPLVLLLEDLHWADPSSIDLLRHLSLRLPGQRLLILVTFRPDEVERSAHPLRNYRAELVARSSCEEIEPGPLTLDDVAAYLDARFASNEFPADLARALHAQTEGHPLFMTSLVQVLCDRGDIRRVGDRWTLTRAVTGELDAPEGLRSIIRQQVDALEDVDRRALQYASIEADEFLSTVVARLTGLDELMLEERLHRLARVNRMIRSTGEEELPDGALAVKYRFIHALHRNVLYDDLVSRRRVLLHREAGEQLLAHYGGQAPRIAAQLAMHFERGRDFERAVTYRVCAGDNAAAMYANPEAERHYSEALRLADRLPDADRQRLAIHRRRGTVNLHLSRFDRALADFESMRLLAARLGDVLGEAVALNGVTRVLFYSHRLEEMARSADEALKAGERAGDAAVRLETMTLIGLKQIGNGELRAARPLLDETIATARRLGHKPSLCASLAWRGSLHYWHSEYADADRALSDARELASDLRDGFVLLFSLFIQGLARGNQGRMSDALDCLNEASEIAARNGDQFWSTRLPNCIGWIYRELQDFPRALRHDSQGLDVGGARHVLEAQANALINLGLDYTELHGEPARTALVFDQVRDIFARDAWFRWRYSIRLEAAAAEHWLRNGDPARAATHADRLDRIAREHDAWKYVAMAEFLRARIADARGEEAATLERLAAAAALLRAHPAPLVGWKVSAMIGRVELARGRAAAAADAFAESADIIRAIAGNVRDEELRATFLQSPAIREVLSAAVEAGGQD